MTLFRMWSHYRSRSCRDCCYRMVCWLSSCRNRKSLSYQYCRLRSRSLILCRRCSYHILRSCRSLSSCQERMSHSLSQERSFHSRNSCHSLSSCRSQRTCRSRRSCHSLLKRSYHSQSYRSLSSCRSRSSCHSQMRCFHSQRRCFHSQRSYRSQRFCRTLMRSFHGHHRMTCYRYCHSQCSLLGFRRVK